MGSGRNKRQFLKEGSRTFNSENWVVYHPNGKKRMFVCGRKRANWYLNHFNDDGEPLAIKYPEKHEFAIKLTFEPKGNGYDEDDIFGLSPRQLRCVVTGIEDGLQRHHIVPYCYRSHFPEEYKSKNHHDVVLIRFNKHEEYEREADKFKDKIAEMYDVPTLSECNLKYTKLLTSFTDDKIKSISRLYSIFAHHGKIPDEKIKENLIYVADDYGFDRKFLLTLSYVQIYKLYTILKKEYDENFREIKEEHKLDYDHGYHVVKKLDTHEKIEDFVKMWRAHFLQTMKPKYMPIGWSVDFRVKVEIS